MGIAAHGADQVWAPRAPAFRPGVQEAPRRRRPDHARDSDRPSGATARSWLVPRLAWAVIGGLGRIATGWGSRARDRRRFAVILLLHAGPLFLLAAGCATPDQTEREIALTTPLPESRFAAVVVMAGSDEQVVFDNARRAFAERLRATSPVPLVTTMLSARRGAVEDGVFPATLRNIDAAFARTALQASACLLFATSHGVPREGLVLTRRRELLTPAYLDRVLDRHCAGKPTVAIVSGCFSGIFADAPMRSDDRIVLTAASRDRPSFGCSNDLTYTYFDDALLRLLPEASTWDRLYEDLRIAITARERRLDVPPSRPQASFGSAVPKRELLDG